MPEPTTIPTVEYKDFSLRLHRRYWQRDRVIKAQLEITYRCNLHCVHCYTDPYNERKFFPQELTLTEIKRIIDEMADLEILYLNLTGGEIFTHPNFFEIYDYAYRKGFLLMLYTNGTIFTRAIIDRLKHSPPFSIDISCHSVNEEAFDRFTQVPGSFRQFLKGMELLRSSGLPPEEVRTLEEHELYSAQDEELCQDTPDWTSSPPERLYRCGCATDSIHISAWGDLGTCTLQYEHRASLRQYSLKDAIAKVFAEVRARRYRTDSPCKTCGVYAFCDKTPTDARWESGDPEAAIPYDCDVALTRGERVFRRKLIHPLATIKEREGAPHD